MCFQCLFKKYCLHVSSFTQRGNLWLTLSPSLTALETTQAELFDLKTKYDEESTAKYVSRWSMCVFADDFSPLAPPDSVAWHNHPV